MTAKSTVKGYAGNRAVDWQTPVCAEFHNTIELIGKRWTGAILAVLMRGPQRFGEILGAVPGLSDRLLTERLRELEDRGVVTRKIFAERPIRIEYGLSDAGQDLDQLIKVITSWGIKWFPERVAGDGRKPDRVRKGAKPAVRGLRRRKSSSS